MKIFKKIKSLINNLDYWLCYESPICIFWKFNIKHNYYKIHDFLFPRQKWLMKNIKNSWMDKTSIIPQVLFNCIIDFIEEEKALTIIDWDIDEDGKKFRLEMIECYNWAKTERAQLDKQMWAAYPEITPERKLFKKLDNGNYEYIPSKKTYEEEYGEVDRLEKLINETDTKWLTWLVINRDKLWA
jgi:hypothetical protein